jgi:hypothetical protein
MRRGNANHPDPDGRLRRSGGDRDTNGAGDAIKAPQPPMVNWSQCDLASDSSRSTRRRRGPRSSGRSTLGASGGTRPACASALHELIANLKASKAIGLTIP